MRVQAHVEAVARAVASLGADIVNLNEVEGCSILSRLVEEPALAGAGLVPYVVEGRDSSTRQQVGLLSRLSPLTPLQRTDARMEYP